jgi:hypothetical protein
MNNPNITTESVVINGNVNPIIFFLKEENFKSTKAVENLRLDTSLLKRHRDAYVYLEDLEFENGKFCYLIAKDLSSMRVRNKTEVKYQYGKSVKVNYSYTYQDYIFSLDSKKTPEQKRFISNEMMKMITYVRDHPDHESFKKKPAISQAQTGGEITIELSKRIIKAAQDVVISDAYALSSKIYELREVLKQTNNLPTSIKG